jgi:hypothetical protein
MTRIVAFPSGKMDLVCPIHLLFNILTMARDGVDFDVRISPLHGKLSNGDAGLVIAPKKRWSP